MSSWPRAVAVGVSLLTALIAVTGIAAAVPTGDPAVLVTLAVVLTAGAASTGLGLLVAYRRPGNPVGAVLCWIGLLPPAIALLDLNPPVPPVVEALAIGAWTWLYVPVALLILLFPDGRVPGPGWRWVALALPGVALGFQAMAALAWDSPYPVLPEPVAIALTALLLPSLLGLLVASAVSMRVRYRRADPVARVRLKWLALAALALPATLLLCWLSYLLLSGPDLVVIGLLALYLGVPAATAIAILRHDLYDVDRALSAAVTYGAVTAGLLAVFTLVSFAGGVLLGGGSAVAAAGATA
ncbi:MAG: hypothetical protein ACRDT6_27795, partial [Micromonosporaceae bacterium]